MVYNEIGLTYVLKEVDGIHIDSFDKEYLANGRDFICKNKKQVAYHYRLEVQDTLHDALATTDNLHKFNIIFFDKKGSFVGNATIIRKVKAKDAVAC